MREKRRKNRKEGNKKSKNKINTKSNKNVFKEIIENASDAVFIVSYQGKFIYVNKKALLMTGYNKKELIGKKINILLADNNLKKVTENLEKRIKKKKADRKYKVSFIRIDKKKVDVEITADLIMWQGEKAVFAIVHDLTEFKNTEKALREKKQEYQELVENINDIIFHLDKKGTIIYINPVVEKITGYKTTELVGRSFSKFIHKDDLDEVKDSFRTILMKKRNYPSEYRIICKNKKSKFVRSFSRVLIKNKKIDGIVGVLSDITEQIKMKKKLKESEEKLSEIVKDLPMFICRFTSSGEIVFVNDYYCNHFNIKKKTILKRNFFKLGFNKKRGFNKKFLSSLTFQKPFLIYEHHQDDRYEGWTIKAIFDDNKKIKAYQVIGKDITNKKESENKLVESYEYLGVINRQISVFLNLNNALKWKDKNKIIEDILSATLEISNAEYVALYEKKKQKGRFNLLSLVSRNEVSSSQKSKIATLSLMSKM